MANSNEVEQKETKAKPELSSNKKAPDDKPHHSIYRRFNSVVSGISVALALTALIIVQANKKLEKNLLQENKILSAELTKIKESQKSALDQVEEKTADIHKNQGELENKFNGLNKDLQTALKQSLYQNQDWLLLKARYYLELAQINAHWSNNFNATIALLRQADNLLKQLNAPKVFEVRQTIAKEISMLQATPSLDIAGLLSQLDAAQASVSKLTIQSTITDSGAEEEADTPQTSNPSAWRSRLQDSVNLLEKLVIVRRNDEDIQPLMSPLFESILRESIRLNLQEAQWAILNNNPVVFQLALKQATTNLKRTFNQQAPNTITLLQQLNELQKITITQEKPEIGQALPLLNQMIDDKELLGSQTNSGKGEN